MNCFTLIPVGEPVIVFIIDVLDARVAFATLLGYFRVLDVEWVVLVLNGLLLNDRGATFGHFEGVVGVLKRVLMTVQIEVELVVHKMWKIVVYDDIDVGVEFCI